MRVSRRRIMAVMASFFAVPIAGCNQVPPSPAAPTPVPPRPGPTSITLMQALHEQGYPSARTHRHSSGAYMVMINNSVNWNFLIDGIPVGLNNSSVLVDVPTIQIPAGSRISVVRR